MHKEHAPPPRAVQLNKVHQPQRESHACFTRRFAADKRCSLGRTNAMTLPYQYQNASLEFERFMVDARDLAGLSTTNMAWNMVVGVLHTFRRRLSIDQALRFAAVLPPVLRALFIEEWQPAQAVAAFGTNDELLAEIRSLRAEHNFSPPNAIQAVAGALRKHVDQAALQHVLSTLPAQAQRFWSAEAA